MLLASVISNETSRGCGSRTAQPGKEKKEMIRSERKEERRPSYLSRNPPSGQVTQYLQDIIDDL
jgi:hypothetical protein